MKAKNQSTKDRIFTIFLFLGISFTVFTQTDPTVVATAPVANALGVDNATTLGLTFSETMDATTLTADNVKISGSYGRPFGFPALGSNTNTAVFDPDRDFFPGELITATLTTGVASNTGTPLESPFTYSFTAGVSPLSPGEFPNGQNIISTLAEEAEKVAVADLDGDGDLDVLSASSTSINDKIAWYENDGNGNFGIQQTIITGAGTLPKDVTTADLDGDGDLDVIASFFQGVEWFENDGNGNFGSQRTITGAVSNPESMTTADLDGDGDLDVLLASSLNHLIAWYENDGNGNFGTQQNITGAANLARDVTTADLDGDGDLDVIAALSYGVVWLENDGSGNFGGQRTLSTTARGIYSVTTADLDGDRDLDVLFAHPHATTIAWFENDGNGNFGGERAITTSVHDPRSVTTGDLDGDGDLDVLSASYEVGRISWYENNGDGNFGGQQTITTAVNAAIEVATGDLDGDGDLDVLSASNFDDKIAWYENAVPSSFKITATDPAANSLSVDNATGIGLTFSEAVDAATLTANNVKISGSYGPPLGFSALGSNTNTAIFNPDRDFFPGELITATLTKGMASITGNPLNSPFTYSFTAGVNPNSPGDFPNGRNIIFEGTQESPRNDVTMADLDGDGDLDIIAAYENDGGVWYENDGGGNLSVPKFITSDNSSFSRIIPADLDGDGDLDVLALTSDDKSIDFFLNDGSENFTKGIGVAVIPNAAPPRTLTDLTIGDLDGDGDLDLIATSSDRVVWFPNHGLTFSGAQRIPTIFGAEQTIANLIKGFGGRSVVNAIADLDGDGDLDVLSTFSASNEIAWYENDGYGNFSGWQTITQAVNQVRNMIVADLNGDGNVDVISTSAADNRIAWHPNFRNGRFGSRRTITQAVDGIQDVTVADLDGDGDLDLLSASANDNKVAWYPNDGNGNFGAQQIITTEALGALNVSTGDLDGDGDLDVISAHSNKGAIAWYENAASPLTVVATDPATNALDVDNTTTLGLTFNQTIDAATLTADNIKITGNYGQPLGFPIPSTNANTAVFDPDRDFFPGELITATLTTEVAGSAGLPLDSPFTYSFTAAVSPDSPGEFPNGQNIIFEGTQGSPRNDVTVADLDGDGDLDVLAAHEQSIGGAWYENDGNGNFGALQSIDFGNGSLRDIVTADLDGDGNLDVLATTTLDGGVDWYLNNGSGNFTKGIGVRANSFFEDFTVGDLDGDGDLDILAASSLGKLAWHPNEGLTFYGAQSVPTIFGTERIIDGLLTETGAVAIADLDGDGDLDALVTTFEKIAWYENDGHGNFGTSQTITLSADGAEGMIVADMDGNGHLDVISTYNNENQIAWYPNYGNGNFSGHGNLITTDAESGASIVTIADLDGDGDLDVVSTSISNSSSIFWYENDGSGNFDGQQTITTEALGTLSVSTGDLDGDGDLDVLSARSDKGIIAWYENVGSTILTANCADPFTIQLDASGTASITVDDIDNGSQGATGMEIDITDFDCSHLGENTVTLTVTNALGNTETCTTTVTVEDSIAPVADRADLPEVRGECNATITTMPTATDNCTGAVTATTSDPLTYDEQGTFTVTWTYDDGNGNTSTQEQTVIVENSTAPPLADVAVLPEVRGECNATVTEVPTATDNCGGTITATTNDPLTYDEQGAFTVTWTYDAGNGNISTQEQTVIVEDAIAPVADITVLPEVRGECGATVTIVPTATDNCAGTVTATTSDLLAYTEQGTYTVTWTYGDGNGNTSTQEQNVIVESSIASATPDMASLPEVRGECSATVTTAPTATADCGGTVTATTNDPLEYSEQGTFIVTWTYDIGNGNTSTQEQTVIVEDAMAPVADRADLPDIIGGCGATVTSAPTATDNCAGTVTATTNDPLAYTEQGTYTITWTYGDGNGNTSTQVQNVVVESSIASATPDIAVLPEVKGECSATVTTVPTATDNCGGIVTATTNDPLTYNEQGTFIVTWTYGTGNGNVSTQTQTVIVEDLVPPMAIARDITVELDENGQATIAAEDIDNGSTDNCGIADISLDTTVFDCPGLGDATVELTVTDVNGNTGSATATVTFTATDNNSDGVADTCGSEVSIVPGPGVSPNQDGINDTWVIENIADHPDALVKVFDRNGREVLSTDNYQNDWGGTEGTGGNLLPVGSYYYIVHLRQPTARNVTGWLYLNY